MTRRLKKFTTSRRSILWGGAAALAAYAGHSRLSRAFPEPHSGTCVLSISVAGAWDPRFVTDPSTDPDHNHLTNEIGMAGGIRYSPVPLVAGMDGYSEAEIAEMMTNEAFFTKHAHHLVALNGVKCHTISHSVGQRQTWTGNLNSGRVYPVLGALTAGALAPSAPLAFMSSGGVDITAGIVPLTRFGGLDSLADIARPEAATPNYDYEPPDIRSLVVDASMERSEARSVGAPLSADRREAERYARSTSDLLALGSFEVPGGEGLPSVIKGQAGAVRGIMSAFASGLCAGGLVTLSGFDTHADHDDQAPPLLARLWRLIDFAVDEAVAAGVYDRLVIVVGSDFGRSPLYNPQNGKSHHPVGTVLVLSPLVEGGRSIGAMTESGGPAVVDPITLEPDDGGEVLDLQSVHLSLRRLLGIAEHPLCADAFPIAAPQLAIFD